MSHDSTPLPQTANDWRHTKIRQPLAVGIWSVFLFLFYALAVYTMVMAIIGNFVGYDFRNETSSLPLWVTISSLTPVILTAWPVQKWIRRQVAHLIAWESSSPNNLVNQLTQQIVTTPTADQLMPTLVQQLATMLNAPYVAIESQHPALSAAIGEPTDAPLIRLPLQNGTEQLGHLLLAPRELAGMPVQFNDQLLVDVARQVSLTLWAAQLSVDLQTSRLRIVTAREEARRQLRRDLHDGLGAGLASMTLQADTAMELVRDDPETAVTLLESLIAQTEQTTRELRRVIHDLRPPVLDDMGLNDALYELTNINTPTQFTLKLPPTLPILPAAIEVALYRITQEAITNIIKHAKATQATIILDLSNTIATLKIHDNGQGLVVGSSKGIGLHSMRERAEELGGTVIIQSNSSRGYQVTAQIPLRGIYE